MAARLTAYLVSIIVGATLVAGLIVGAQNDGGGPVDLIIYNGRVHTGAGEPMAEAVAVRGNRIVRVGTNWQVRRLRSRHTQLIDARYGTVLPGLNEAHARVAAGGASPDDGIGDAAPVLQTLEPAEDDRLEAIRATLGRAHALGITSLQDSEANASDLERYEALRRAGALHVRTYAALPIEAGLTNEDATRLDAIRTQYADDPLLKAGAVRITVSDVAETTSVLTQDELNRLVALMDGRGWQVIVHAASDGAATMALEAFAYAAAVNADEDGGRRHRIELHHLADELELTPSQSLSIVTTASSETVPFYGLFDGRHRFVLGNRWPAAVRDPLAVIMAAGGEEPDTGLPNGAALAAAIDAYTRAPAYASFDERRKGAVAPDLLADLVVLSADIFSLPAERRDEVFVRTTIFDGRVVYTRTEGDAQTE